jgi:hypothetical protein
MRENPQAGAPKHRQKILSQLLTYLLISKVTGCVRGRRAGDETRFEGWRCQDEDFAQST